MSGLRNQAILGVLVARMLLAFPAFAAKRKPADAPADPPAKTVTTADASKAELNATLALANVRVSRVSVAEDPGLESVREVVGAIRQHAPRRAIGADGPTTPQERNSAMKSLCLAL